MLKQNPSLMPTAVRELARYNSPVQLTGRTAIQDFVWHGQQIQQGQSIILLIGSANHDSEKYTDPERLDITRNQSQISRSRRCSFVGHATWIEKVMEHAAVQFAW
jgi:cytochrome P450